MGMLRPDNRQSSRAVCNFAVSGFCLFALRKELWVQANSNFLELRRACLPRVIALDQDLGNKRC